MILKKKRVYEKKKMAHICILLIFLVLLFLVWYFCLYKGRKERLLRSEATHVLGQRRLETNLYNILIRIFRSSESLLRITGEKIKMTVEKSGKSEAWEILEMGILWNDNRISSYWL